MNRKRQNQIEQLASNLLRETGCYEYPPIDVELVARRKGIEVYRHQFSNDVSGLLMTKGDVTLIGVNENNNERRQRFTIAHELGHYTLGHQRQGFFLDSPDKYYTMFNFRNDQSSTGEFLQEREANAFAASLLMPIDLIMEVVSNLSIEVDVSDDSVNIVDLLAKSFNVSNQAMALRLSNIGTLW